MSFLSSIPKQATAEAMSPTKNQVAPDDAVPLPGSTDGQNGNGTENNGIAHVTEPGQLPVCRIAVQRHDTDTATPVNGKEQEVSLVSTAHGGLQGQLNSMEEVEAANKAPLEEPLVNSFCARKRVFLPDLSCAARKMAPGSMPQSSRSRFDRTSSA